MHVLAIHRCAPTLQQICQALQRAGLTCECHSSPVAAVYSFAFSKVPFDAVFVDRALMRVPEGNVLRVIQTLQPGVPVHVTDTAVEAFRAAFDLLRMAQGPHILPRESIPAARQARVD